MNGFKGKHVLVIGLGESGFAAACLLNILGARVCVTESSSSDEIREREKKLGFLHIPCETGKHTRSFCDSKDFAIVSPGIPPDALPLLWLVSQAVPVYSEIELGCSLLKAPFVAVTGTNGKTTTAYLLFKMFSDAGFHSRLLGNVGTPVSAESLKVKEDDIPVLEVSSYQLERISSFKPYVSIFLNLTPDHLDRYGDMEPYAQAKFRIFENQTKAEWAVLNRRDELLFRRYCVKGTPKTVFINLSGQEEKGVFVEENEVISNIFGKHRRICKVEEIPLSGRHNLENILAAVAAAHICGVDVKDMTKSILRFPGVEHRLERCGQVQGVAFINDSKSTNVDSAVKALEAIHGPIVFIIGGRDKIGDYQRLGPLVTRKVRETVLIGEARPLLRKALKNCCVIREAEDLKEAVHTAYKAARKGDTILLSPACSSFDMFRDFEERGRVFKEVVQGLKSSCA